MSRSYIKAKDRPPPGIKIFFRCGSVNEFYCYRNDEYRCVQAWDHVGLCHDGHLNHGPWEDRYRIGYKYE